MYKYVAIDVRSSSGSRTVINSQSRSLSTSRDSMARSKGVKMIESFVKQNSLPMEIVRQGLRPDLD